MSVRAATPLKSCTRARAPGDPTNCILFIIRSPRSAARTNLHFREVARVQCRWATEQIGYVAESLHFPPKLCRLRGEIQPKPRSPHLSSFRTLTGALTNVPNENGVRSENLFGRGAERASPPSSAANLRNDPEQGASAPAGGHTHWSRPADKRTSGKCPWGAE